MFHIACTRFNNFTYRENKEYRDRYNEIAIYGTAFKIRNIYSTGSLIFIAEMNNETNKIKEIKILNPGKNYKTVTAEVLTTKTDIKEKTILRIGITNRNRVALQFMKDGESAGMYALDSLDGVEITDLNIQNYVPKIDLNKHISSCVKKIDEAT